MEKFVGSYRVKRIVSLNVIKLDLPSSIRLYPVVNISRIYRYRNQVKGQKVMPPLCWGSLWATCIILRDVP